MNEPTDPILRDPELDDVEDETPFTLARIDVALLTSPVVLRAIGGVVIGAAVMTWPNRSDFILARLVGAALIVMALTAGVSIIRLESRRALATLAAVVTLAVGVTLVIDPDQATLFGGRLLGLYLVASSLFGMWGSVRREERDSSALTFQALMLAIGVLLIVFTEAVTGTVIVMGAIAWIMVSLVVLVVSLDANTTGVVSYADTTELITDWLRDRPKSIDARQALYDKILYEGPTTQTRVVRFFALMLFASVIASMGVITDSTAVVIGAMLIAPLMTPLMGMAISLVMGWPNRLARSAVVAGGGILLAIGIGVALGLVAPALIDPSTNSQILSRTSPTDVDLIIAIAAGAAGAYGLSRPDVSDALPGVAIAIALVPPLSVVGIAYSQAEWAAGNGALLLFATNMIAILMVGGLTFVFTGVTPIARVAENQHRVRTAVGVTCIAAVIVFGGLLLNGAQIAADLFQQSTAEATVNRWLGDDAGYRLINAEIDDRVVTVVVIGPADGLPDVDALADSLSGALDKTITVEVSLVVEERFSATGNP